MKSKTLYMGLVAIAISALIVGIAVSASSSDSIGKLSDKQSETNRSVTIDETLRKIYGDNATLVIASEDDLLGKYEKSDMLFKRTEIGDMRVYRHQRMIDGAKVEKDRIIYQFDDDTKELKKKIIHWRDDLPEHLPLVIPNERAESMVVGEVQFSKLYIISPDSWRFPIKPTPENPCWMVRSVDKNGYIIDTIIDAVEGKILGYGVPPESAGLSFSGPQDVTNCTGTWGELCDNAEVWFESMGYFPTEVRIYPNEDAIRKHIQSYETAMFYYRAHSVGTSSSVIRNNCSDTMTADEIHDWIENYPKMPFTFVGGCYGMCDTGPGTLSYEFRKGSMGDTVTIGQCGMSEPECGDCWDVALDWQDALFNYMNQGWTVKTAFNQAVADYPDCDGCVRFAGDPNFKVVPVVGRGIVAIAKSDHRYNNAYRIWPYSGDWAYGGIAKLDGSQSHDPDGYITEYKWEFGDGEVGYGETVEHMYKAYKWIGGSSGHYEPFAVSLTVKDNEGNSDTISTDVNVCIAGDANGDGEANILDAVWVGMHWRATCNGGGDYVWDDEQKDGADLNNDCELNILDPVIIGQNWRKTAW